MSWERFNSLRQHQMFSTHNVCWFSHLEIISRDSVTKEERLAEFAGSWWPKLKIQRRSIIAWETSQERWWVVIKPCIFIYFSFTKILAPWGGQVWHQIRFGRLGIRIRAWRNLVGQEQRWDSERECARYGFWWVRFQSLVIWHKYSFTDQSRAGQHNALPDLARLQLPSVPASMVNGQGW